MVLKFRNDPVKQLLDLIGILGEKKLIETQSQMDVALLICIEIHID